MKDAPWRDPEKLERLYWGEMLTLHEVADELGCSHGCIHRWMKKFDIPRRKEGYQPGLTMHTYDGYECFWQTIDGEPVNVKTHQLLACVEHDPHDVFDASTVVHHQNECRFDNRLENIEVMGRDDHTAEHNRTRKTSES